MTDICWFAFFRRDRPAEPAELDAVRAIIAQTPDVSDVLLHTPAQAHDPYLHDGAPPVLAMQLIFPTIAGLEAALDGHLRRLIPWAGATASQQAMLVRRFPVPDPEFRHGPDGRACTYLVAYEGEAEDTPAWLAYYIAHHPPIMARFPGIRAIEIYTRLDWCGAVPWPREAAMQRNKVVFDSPEALTAALNSPVRHEMRADFHKFPPFTGRNTHYPMLTDCVLSGATG
jgi:uncharacterized protein (TIGR02118 family)